MLDANLINEADLKQNRLNTLLAQYKARDERHKKQQDRMLGYMQNSEKNVLNYQ